MDLVRRFGPDVYSRALEDWAWLIGDRAFVPLASSLFGDTFLQATDGVWFLDMLEGTLTLRWPDIASLQETLMTEDGQDDFLMGGLAIGAGASGVTAGSGEVLMFKIAPVLGGPIDVTNIESMDFVVASSICGQLHRQVADLPTGATISGFTVDGQEP